MSKSYFIHKGIGSSRLSLYQRTKMGNRKLAGRSNGEWKHSGGYIIGSGHSKEEIREVTEEEAAMILFSARSPA